MGYAEGLFVLVCIYIVLGTSFNLTLGYTGLLALCQAAFYGLGAYASSVVTLQWGWPLVPAALAGMAVAGAGSLLISWPSVRIRGVYLVILSLGFQMIVFNAFMNGGQLTNGPGGLRGIPPLPGPLGWSVGTTAGIYAAAIAGLTLLVAWRIVSSPLGRVLKAIREDEVACQSLGKNVTTFKVLILGLSSALAAVAGLLYARYVRFISPDSFDIQETFFIFMLVVVGGAGTLRGPIAGSLFVVLVPELLRLLPLSAGQVHALIRILFGLLIVLTLRYRPQGIWGDYAADREPAADETTLADPAVEAGLAREQGRA